jgi:hypothetical protein
MATSHGVRPICGGSRPRTVKIKDTGRQMRARKEGIRYTTACLYTAHI